MTLFKTNVLSIEQINRIKNFCQFSIAHLRGLKNLRAFMSLS
ncbi:hypothetical protein SynMITS9220_01589 [Synechococcus sp. MIT S9220]|nr:hypothetical protein SynMITS9220_01589 [Synechococcus sp. MIT S9220]